MNLLFSSLYFKEYNICIHFIHAETHPASLVVFVNIALISKFENKKPHVQETSLVMMGHVCLHL